MKEWAFERIFSLIFGTFLLVSYVQHVGPFIFSLGWPMIDGRVVLSAVRDGDLFHETYIEYSYTVDGKDYLSHTIQPFYGAHYCISHSSAVDIINRFPVGSRIQLSYDPSNPNLSILNYWWARHGIETYIGDLYIFLIILFLGFGFGGWDLFKPNYDEAGTGGHHIVSNDLKPKSKE